MKAKKATKRLKKAHSLLSVVIEDWPEIKKEIRDLLFAAADDVRRAVELAEASGSSSASPHEGATESQAGSNSTKRRGKRRFTDEARKKLSLAAKKRWAAAKRSGVKSLAS